MCSVYNGKIIFSSKKRKKWKNERKRSRRTNNQVTLILQYIENKIVMKILTIKVI